MSCDGWEIINDEALQREIHRVLIRLLIVSLCILFGMVTIHGIAG